jgi:hypothetical protein
MRRQWQSLSLAAAALTVPAVTMPTVMVPAVAASTPGAELSPQDFAYGMAIVTPGAAAAYRVVIPPEVYLKSVRPQLGDLQVFNDHGEAVPFAIEQPPAPVDPQPPARSLTLYALRDDSPDALNAMRVTIASQGSAVSVQTTGPGTAIGAPSGVDAPSAPGAPSAVSADPSGRGTISYVLDAQGLGVPIAAIQLHWPADAADYAGNIRVAAGDTLGLWHTVVDAAPIANLHADGAQLLEDRIAVPATRARFWRLSWVGKPPPFALTSAAAEPATDRDTAERSHLIVPGTPVRDKPGEFEFDLGARPPVDRLNIELPEPNSVINVEFLSRADANDLWHHVASAGIYRLQGAEGELRNAPVVIGITQDRYWLLRAPPMKSALGNGVPRLVAQWRAPELVFLARGAGPFMLAYGSGSAIGAATSFTALPATVTAVRATLAAPQSLGGDGRLQPESSIPWKNGLLWLVLAAAVVLLAGMALRLAKDLKPRGT